MQQYKPIRIYPPYGNKGRMDWQQRQFTYFASRLSLCQKPDGKPGRDYLLLNRKLDIETIAKFRLGYVPFSVRDHPFAGRLVIPIFDAYSNLIALSVRPVVDDKESLDAAGGKYWNESFPKGEHLYGLCLAKYAIAKMGFAILVEGQMDTMAMHSYGLANTVGMLGGAFTPFHAMALKKWCRQLVIMTDGDKAGQKHAEKCKETLEIFGTSSRKGNDSSLYSTLVALPEGSDEKDPDLFLQRNGSYIMRSRIADAMRMSGMAFPEDYLK